MSPKFARLLLVATVAAGFGILPMPGAWADAAVKVHDLPTGFQQTGGASGQCKKTSDAYAVHTDINKGDSVNWYFDAGNTDKHNVTPANDVAGGSKWPSGVDSNDKAPGDPDPVVVTFKDAGLYFYYSSFNGEGSDNKGQLNGMCGVVRVIDPNATTTTSTPPDTAPPATTPPTTPTTAPPATTGTTAPASAIPSAAHPATPAAPAPTTTITTKPEKDKKGKEATSSSSSTTAPQVNGPVDLPADAIVPTLPSGATATQDGAVLPAGTPTGDATAVIQHPKHGHGPVILLVLSGLGIGGLGVGVGIYKFANRSSRYFPA